MPRSLLFLATVALAVLSVVLTPAENKAAMATGAFVLVYGVGAWLATRDGPAPPC